MRTMTIVSLAVASIVVLVAAAASWWAWNDRYSPEAKHRRIVKLHLNDPESGVFRGSWQAERDKTVWCGEINARNRMGGMVGFTRYVAYLPAADLEPDSMDDRDLRLFSEVFFEPGDQPERDAFESKWRMLCDR